MILQALAEYYERKMGDEEDPLPPFGFERKEIPFVIVLDQKGNFVDLEDTRTAAGRRNKGREFVVPQAVKRTVAVKANLLWDNPEYVLGLDTKGKPERAVAQRVAFTSTVRSLAEATADSAVSAVLSFLERGEFASVIRHPTWSEVAGATNASLSFRIDGEQQLVCQRPLVRRAIAEVATPAGDRERCLATGEMDIPARLHPSIKGVWGAQTAGANIVSFNLAAFNSYGRSQGYNAPVGERATFAYTTALNHLLRSDSPQRLQVADASTVFWAERSHPMEAAITAFFGEPPKDDPRRGVDAVKALYGAPRSGHEPLRLTDDTRFYVLGLSPNASRIAIRFWHVSTVGELAARFREHFDDLRLTHAPFESDVNPLWRLLASTAVQEKTENVRPNLGGAWMQSILSGAPYPRELLTAAVQRNRAEQDVSYPRAALIKAYLNRESRHGPHTSSPELTVSLDRNNSNPAYRLGRLFAVLERVQESANPGLNATIRDRYYGAASTTSVTVFPRLIKLSGHHLAKLENPGLRVFYEKEMGDIISEIAEFPPILSLPDQGRFSIGYYHQRQDAFTKRTAEQGEAA